MGNLGLVEGSCRPTSRWAKFTGRITPLAWKDNPPPIAKAVAGMSGSRTMFKMPFIGLKVAQNPLERAGMKAGKRTRRGCHRKRPRPVEVQATLSQSFLLNPAYREPGTVAGYNTLVATIDVCVLRTAVLTPLPWPDYQSLAAETRWPGAACSP